MHTLRRAMHGNLRSLVLVAGVAYVLFTGWAMASVSYDVWGAIVVAPVITLVSVPMIRRALSGDLQPLMGIALVGLAAKLVGTLLRYWVAFDAYGGTADAGRYHDAGRMLAARARSSGGSLFDVLPTKQGTEFLEQLTALLYTLVGSSRLAGFLWFSLMGYWGVVLFVKAACLAVPDLARRRYALFCFLAPSLVFWPSSIGKEAWLSLCLGALSLGAAKLFVGGSRIRAVLLAAAGAAGAAMVRPHFAAIWLGALAAALVVSVLSGRTAGARQSRLAQVVLAIVAVVGLVAVGRLTLQYLSPNGDSAPVSVGSALEVIGQETSRRSTKGGSSFESVTISGPADYPLAVLRTLTRPLLPEVTGIASFIPAVETTALLLLAALGWRRLVSLARATPRTPFLVFSILITIMCGVAFSRFGNLAILVRQRSLALPALLVLLCLPAWRPRPRFQPPAPAVRSETPRANSGHR